MPKLILAGSFFFMFMQANISETWQLNSSRFAWTEMWEISSSSLFYETQHAVKPSFFSNWIATTCCIWQNVKTRRDQGLGMGQDISSICWMSGHLWRLQTLTSIAATRLTDPPTKLSKWCRAEHITAALSATPASQNHYVWTKILKFDCLTSASLHHWSCASINSSKDFYKSQHAHASFYPLSEVSSLRFKIDQVTSNKPTSPCIIGLERFISANKLMRSNFQALWLRLFFDLWFCFGFALRL